MHKAVDDTAKAGDGGSDLIANVAAGGNAAGGNAAAGNGAKADKDSVTGIAKGMKAIVDAAKKAGVELKADDVAGGGANNNAGRLFANGNNGNAGTAADAQAQGAAEKAGEAVSAVSGDQILKAIVDAAGTTEGKRANTATNAVEAAIGADGNAEGEEFTAMQKKNQIAAAIVLRGLAKGGKFANTNDAANGTKVKAAVKSAVGWIKEMHKAVEDTAKAGNGGSESIANVAAGGAAAGNAGDGAKADAGSVTGIAKGMKAIVEAAKKAGVELKAADADGGANNNAGRLFASGAAVADNDAQGAAEKAGEAVSAVSGDQILKAIVDAAESTEGKGAAQAKDAVEAAIGGDNNAEGAAFGANMKKKNQIAAAIVLRGLAKGGKFANANTGDGAKVKAAVNTSEWIKEMKKAFEDTAKAGTGGSNESIANVAAGGANAAAGAGANKDSVTGIAKGMKAIVEAAKKAGVELKAADADDVANGDAGRLFANGNNAGAADAAQGAAEKAGEAVSAVSGDQILKAIVDAAGTTEGKGAAQATNAVEAAIGGDNNGAAGVAFADGNMKKKNQIAAAIVLRGLAKGGKFANTNAAANGKVKAAVKTSEWIKEMHKAVEDTAKAGTGSESIANVAAGGADAAGNGAKADAGSVTGIAKGMKAIVDAAKKAGVEFKPADAADVANGDAAGRLFASGNNGNAGGEAQAQGAAAKAGEAVSAVSGDQILKAIIDAAGSTAGKGAGTAKDAVEAAIGGGGNAAGVAFGDNMKKNQIAAAIVLRGLAKDGKFANTNDAGANGTKVVAAVKSAVGWIKEMHKAVEDTAKAGTGSNESIANVAAGGGGANGNGAKADAGSVTGIAKGMKAIVDAAKKAGVELKADAADGADAGGNADAAQEAAEKAGEAVSAVSGDQILKAIVDAAESTEGKRAADAKDAVEAAIGAGDGAGAAFAANMKKNQIAAAIVLRGLAKGGKFANTNAGAANGEVKAAVKTSEWIKEMHKAVEDTSKAGTGGSDLIANVAAGGAANAGAGKKADKDSVTGIAKGMKAIVEAAKKAGVELKAADAADVANGDAAGRLFASGNNAGAGNDGDAQGAAEKAGEAVSAVSGDQILKAIVDAAESTAGKRANDAKDAVEAAIGGDNDAEGEAFGGAMQKKNQIAAAIVLRGLAKDGKFANANDGAGNTKVVASKKASGWIKEMKKAVDDTAKAGTGGSDLIANVAAGGGDGNAGNGAGAGANKDSVTGIAKGMKAIVDAAKKAGVELKPADADGDAGNAAGKLFASGNNARAADAGNEAEEAAEKAGEAVSAVSGDQILKAIVDAAGSTEGKRANTATNAVEAAIGGDNNGAAGVAFADGNMKKKNQIAAAIVLRGLAKDGKFANTNAGDGANGAKVKAAVKTSEWIKEMHKAVEDTAKAGTGSESIANVAAGGADAAGNGAKADKDSVTGIAKGMKAIVDAAKKAGVELKADAAAGGGGDAAGRLFASGAAGADDEAQGAAEKAGEAVSAVSGDQILKAIIDAAESTGGKSAGDATNAVEAAIGGDNDAEGEAFGGDMQKNDQIAAAIVLRGLAKDGKFANANAGAANGAKVVAAVKHMHRATEDTINAADFILFMFSK